MYWLLPALLTVAWAVSLFSLDLGIGCHVLLVGAVMLAEIRLIPLLTGSPSSLCARRPASRPEA